MNKKYKDSSAEVYRHATDQASIVSITDINGIIIHVNEKFCEISGYSLDEVLGKNHRIVNSGEHSKFFFEEMWTTLLRGEHWRGEICNKRKDGSLYWVDTNITPIRDDKGIITELISIRSDITNKKKYEDILAEEKNTLSFVLESSKTAMFQYFPKISHLEYDTNFLEVLGLDSSDLTDGMDSIFKYMKHEDIFKFKKELDIHFKGLSKSFNYLFRFIHPNGRYLHILCRGKVIRWDSEGKAELFVGTQTDLTEQLSTESLLRRTQDIARIGSWEFLVEGEKVTWSPMVYKIHGYEPDSFIPTIDDGMKFYAPEHREVIAAEFERTMKTGIPFDLELQIINSDGKKVWVRSVGQGELSNGKVLRVYGTFQDIDEKKKIELELVDSKKHLDIALEAAGVGIWEFFPQRGKLIWDKSMYAVYEVGDDFDVSYENWRSLVSKDDIERVEEQFKKLLEDPKANFDINFKLEDETGKNRFIQAKAFAEFNAKGEVEQVHGLNWDITKEKEFERYLIEARESALGATKAKSNFLASMSHEIRTPMNGVHGMLELLADTELNNEQREILNTLKASSNSLLAVVNDVLDFSKIEAGKLDLEYRAFEIKKLLGEIAKAFSYSTQTKGIEIKTNLGDDLPDWVVGDETRLRQVLTNLISNSLKFTSEGKIEISANVDFNLSKNNKANIVFKVEDTGIGIPKDKLPLLFDSFSQVDSSTTRKFGGTGLGLAICKSLVSKMDGHIKVGSTLGVGTTFIFDIIVGVEEGEIRVDSPENLNLTIRPNLSILVAEDNLTNQKLSKSFFKKLGFEIDIAENGKEALEMVGEKHFDVIFMDLQMPIMDGLTATEKIIKKFKEAAPLIIAMTANVFQEDQKRCFEAGMKDFIPKPISKAFLKKVLCHHFPGEKKPLFECIENTHINEKGHEMINKEQILFEFLEDFDIFEELVEDYAGSANIFISEMEEAIAKSDSTNLNIKAHTFKGIIANFYSEQFKELAFSLEEMGKENDFKDAMATLEKLKEVNKAVQRELEVFIKNHKESSNAA